MAYSFQQLPGYEVPRNALLDLAPINSAIDQKVALDQQAMRNKFQDRQIGLQERQVNRAEKKDEAELFANRALAVDRLEGPQRQAAWDRLLSTHPDPQNIPAEYRDPMKGPSMVAAEYGKFRDTQGEALKGAQVELTQAQAAKARREASGEMVDYGKTGAIFQGNDGKFYTIQFGSNGQRKIEPVGDGLAPAKGVEVIDEGTRSRVIQKATGADVRVEQKDIAGKAYQQEVGDTAAKTDADLPRVISNSERALKTLDQIRNHPGKQYGVGAAGVLPGIPGTQQRGFVKLVDQAKGQAFLEAFNSLKGGGAITNIEGDKATEAIARLDRAQRPEDFDAALSDLEGIIKTGMANAKTKAQGLKGRMTGGSAQPAQGGPASPRSKEEYDALPSGTQFMAPDGTMRVKP